MLHSCELHLNTLLLELHAENSIEVQP